MASPQPYSSAPDSAFWSRSVSKGWASENVIAPEETLIRKGDKVVSAGSCFASNIVPFLEKVGLTYHRTEQAHPAFADLEPETFGYAKFSAAYGNIYTPRQLLQLLKRSSGAFFPIEDRWVVDDAIVDTLRPGLRYPALSHREFDLLRDQHLRKTYAAFKCADVFIFTLGLTEAWISALDGTVFPACPGTVAGTFDPQKHVFKNFSTAEVCADLDEFVGLLRSINETVKIVLTVSPVPLIATATRDHVLVASTYSKSVLRAAAGDVARHYPNVVYFPAYEIVTGPQAPHSFFDADRRNVSVAGVRAVMRAMLAHCETQGDGRIDDDVPDAVQLEFNAMSTASRILVEAECEEAMADQIAPGISAWTRIARRLVRSKRT